MDQHNGNATPNALAGDIPSSISGLHRLWTNLVELLEDGASIYDEEVDTLIDSIETEFEQFLHSVGIDTQTAMEHPAGNETESSPD